MNISEPMTMFTDYVLGAVYVYLGIRLLRIHRLKLASLAFFTIATAAFVGGTYHGFAAVLSGFTLAVFWRATLASIGLTSFFLLAAVVCAVLTGAVRRVWIAAAALQLCFYLFWIGDHDEFRFAIYDYAAGMVCILCLCVVAARRGQRAFARWMSAAIAVAIAASAVQASGVALARNFNHNDLYHVIQIGAGALFYGAFVRTRLEKNC